MDKRDEHCTRYRSLIESISIQTRIGEKNMEKRKRWTGIREWWTSWRDSVDFRVYSEGKVVGIDASCRERISQLKRRLANPLVTIGFDH